ncbi:DHSO-like protein [Mya arenaria]|uniref:Sorbitol dehydrogenase n=1 Tax=Mya arenaria TaxID=6604 RepID=A0ABY7DS60_MYAAR|nr:DHSO-like protein [Mya arenaria]
MSILQSSADATYIENNLHSFSVDGCPAFLADPVLEDIKSKMADTNLTAILYAKGDIRLLCMQHVGICGSDVHYWQHGNIGDFVVKAPMILGHEAAGIVSKIGDGVTSLKIEEGALLEPLSVGVHACKRAGVTLGTKVLICGADLDEKRLAMAKEMGADHVVKITSKDPKEMADKIVETFGERPDVTIECSGAPPSTRTAILSTRSGGCVVLVGMGPSSVELPVMDAAVREVDIRGIFRYVNCYPTALNMVASGSVNVKPLITHRFKLEQTMDAFETTLRGDGIKVMIECKK